jgi:hypothetical protein
MFDLDLFLRTLSQGFQAFLPVALGLSWLERHGRPDRAAAVRWALVAAVPATAVAGYLFHRSAQQALWEALLAIAAVAAVVWLLARTRDRAASRTALAASTVLLVVRQTMEIAIVLAVAAFELRSRDATAAVCAGVVVAVFVTTIWAWLGRLLPASAFKTGARVFAVLFLGQLAMYAFHESAEARLLPWSDVLHAATEPYGPDSVFGRYVTWLLVAAPVAAALTSILRSHLRKPSFVSRGIGAAVAACLLVVGAESGDRSTVHSQSPAPAPSREATALAAAPHVLFRHTGVDSNYSVLTVASLDGSDLRRVSLGLPCERVAFAAGRGICLQAARGVFTSYKAVIFDSAFKPVASLPLAGGPSRTRVSADGRVGAVTVFLVGHAYSTSQFSTQTTLVDMSSGDVLGELEQFGTWRDGVRIRAKDFNFWGVTFARDSNLFYATLGTAGTTYLVKGDLGLRKLTVIREHVECPSLSPDGRLVAFKKGVGTAAGAWRLYVLDLDTKAERPVAAETRYVDDQVEWLDSAHVLYTIPRPASALTDVWVVPIDGTSGARVMLAEADSPAVVR